MTIAYKKHLSALASQTQCRCVYYEQ